MLGLRCCMEAFSSCGEAATLYLQCTRFLLGCFSCGGAWASVVVLDWFS